ncbi:hypothetical protein [Clostridium rectalis]|uniref:hypothetical protein n=1 Tax=Clostridium rectalis TaxID=2040295 RepID=UPI000F634406|nr:hypothetical protein [Clostridium rectalis]
MKIEIIDYLNENKGYGITISEIEGNEKVLSNVRYNFDKNITIEGLNEFREMEKYIIDTKEIKKIEKDVTNIIIHTTTKQIIIENWN